MARYHRFLLVAEETPKSASWETTTVCPWQKTGVVLVAQTIGIEGVRASRVLGSSLRRGVLYFSRILKAMTEGDS